MKNINVAIGLLASLTLAYQGQLALMGFAWALVHGAGVISVIPLSPLLAGQACLWFGYGLLRRRRPIAFAGYALSVVLVNEALMPRTPLKLARQQQLIDRVEVRSVRDEPYRTSSGELIGIRITVEAVFPKTGGYMLYPTVLLGETPGTPYELGFGTSALATPSPAPQREGFGNLFQQGVVYTFTFDLRPNFIEDYDRAKPPCVRFVPQPAFTDADLMNALSRSRPTHYSTTIEVTDAESSGERFSAARHVTTNAYDVRAIYRTVMERGGGRCRPPQR